MDVCVQRSRHSSANDCEALLAALLEQSLGVFAPGEVEELPVCIAEVEERRAIAVDQKALVVGHLEVTVGKVPGGTKRVPRCCRAISCGESPCCAAHCRNSDRGRPGKEIPPSESIVQSGLLFRMRPV